MVPGCVDHELGPFFGLLAPPGGTGVGVGDVAKDIPWQGSDGGQINLHDFCGEKQVIVMIETAAW